MKQFISDKGFIDIKKLMTECDSDGNDPALVLVTTNRSAGKTVSSLEFLLREWKENGAETFFIFETKTEAESCEGIFEDTLFNYPELGKEVTLKSQASGVYNELFIDGDRFGFSGGLTMSRKLKKYSGAFGKVKYAFRDEYQAENGQYLKGEVESFERIMLTISRGGGHQTKHVKALFLGNAMSKLNPYLLSLGLYKRINSDHCFLKQPGCVAYFDVIPQARERVQSLAVTKLFDTDEMAYSTENINIYNDDVFVTKLTGQSDYVCGIRFKGKDYGIRKTKKGLVHISENIDPSGKIYVFQNSNHDENTILIKQNGQLVQYLKYYYVTGKMRFQNLECKDLFLHVAGINFYE